MPHAIKLIDLYDLVMKYNKVYRIQTFLHKNIRPSKDNLIKELARRNFKIVGVGDKWELHPISAVRRDKKIKMGDAVPKKPYVYKDKVGKNQTKKKNKI